jgi:diguanylate cyclase (GGDEF)-like protein
MLLVLPTPWLDTVDLYQPDSAGNFSVRHAGDSRAFDQREYVNSQFLFDLDASPGAQTLYLRVSTAQAFMVPVELWEPTAFWEHDRLQAGYYGMFYGVLLVMLLYNGFIFLSTRDRSYLFYCLYLIAFFIMNFSYNGFSFQFFWPHLPEWSNVSHTVWIFLFQITGIVFAMVFLGTRSLLPWMHRLLLLLLVSMVITFIASISAGQRIYNAAPVFFVFLYSPLVAVAGIMALRSGYRAARFFVLASMATLVGAFVTALTVYGFLPYRFYGFHAAEFGLIADVILLSLALADRINFLRDQQENAERAILEEKLRATRLLQQAKADLEHTVLERTAELKSAKDEAERLARTDTLTGISNRRYFEEIADKEFKRSQRYQYPLSLIIFDIDHFKQINDRHGHACGDAVIRTAAAAARDCVREVDFVARIGGEEFVVLLPEVTVEQATVTAERIREKIEDMNILHMGETVNFTSSFGVAQAEEQDQDLESLLQRADQMMYQSKRDGRNRVSSAQT